MSDVCPLQQQCSRISINTSLLPPPPPLPPAFLSGADCQHAHSSPRMRRLHCQPRRRHQHLRATHNRPWYRMWPVPGDCTRVWMVTGVEKCFAKSWRKVGSYLPTISLRCPTVSARTVVLYGLLAVFWKQISASREVVNSQVLANHLKVANRDHGKCG